MKHLLFALLLASAALLPRSAFAATTCTASAPDVIVNNYDGTTQQSGTTNVTVSCNSDVDSLFGGTVYVNACLYIGNTPRQMLNGTNTLGYDLYTSSNTVWQGPSARRRTPRRGITTIRSPSMCTTEDRATIRCLGTTE